MFCSRCGAKLEDGSKFCMMCGTPVAAPEPTPVPAPVPAPAPEPAPAPVQLPVAEPVPVIPFVEETPAPVASVAEEAPASQDVMFVHGIPFVEEVPFVDEFPDADNTAYDPIMDEATVGNWMGDATVVYRAGKTPIPPVVKAKPAPAPAAEAPAAPVVQAAPAAAPAPDTFAMDAVPLVPVMETAAEEIMADECTATPAFAPMAPAPQPVTAPAPQQPVAQPIAAADEATVASAPAFAPSAAPIPEAPVPPQAPAPEPIPIAPMAEAAEPKSKKKSKEKPVKEKPVKEKPAKAVSHRRKPHIAVRILLQLLSFILCLVLTVGLVASVVLADLQYIMSKNGMEQLVNTVLTPTAPKKAPAMAGAAGVRLDEADQEEQMPENTDDLISWIYQQIAANSDKPLTVTEEQVKDFLQESDVSTYLAEKMAGYTDDFINGTTNTAITTEEILAVLEENEALIEEAFDVRLTEETKANMKKSIDKLIVEQDINNVIRQQVFTTVEESINQSMSSTGLTWERLQPMVQLACSEATLYIVLALCLLLMLLLCTINSYNIPGGLTWIAVPSMVVGTILTAGLALAPMIPSLIPAVPVAAVEVLGSFRNALLPIHAAVLGLGVLLLIVAIVWRAIRKAVDRKREAAA